MNILHIHTKLVSGGIEAIVCGLANEMSKSHNVTVCTIFEPKEDDVFYAQLSPKVKKISIGKKDYGFSIMEIFKILKIIGSGNYDVVHVHGCFQYYVLATILYHNKTKLFYTVHSDAKMENQTWDRRLFYLKRYSFVHKWMHPVTISLNSKKSFTDVYGCESTLIPNGIKTPLIKNEINICDQYKITSDTVLFIHPGRISKPKNQVVLCQAFESLINKGRDVVLLIAGYPEEKEIYDKLEHFFSNRIIYLGERKDVPQIMSECDAFCLPSIWEGLPVTLLEALSVGCVPICSPVGGIVNVVHPGVDGILSKSPSLEDYESALSSFLDMSQSDRLKMKYKAKENFKGYTIETCASRYIDCYKYS